MQLPNLVKAAGMGTAVLALTATTAFAAVATGSVNVRTGPSTSYRVVDTLRPGERVDIVDRSGGWCRVEKSGPNGWVSCNYLANERRGGDRFDRYDRNRFRDGPSVRLGLNVGPERPRRGWRDRDDDRSGFWVRGPSGGFGFSFNN